MWDELTIKEYPFFERMLGFSLPQHNTVLVIPYEGLHSISLQKLYDVTTDTCYPEGRCIFNRNTSLIEYKGKTFTIFFLGNGQSLWKNIFGETLLLDIAHRIFWVKDKSERVLLTYHYDNFSGDWQYLSFSEDGNFILLGMPYDFHIFQRNS